MSHEQFFITNLFLFLGIGMLLSFLYHSYKDWHAPRFSPMGPWPSKAEEYAQKKLDATAQYKEENQGLVKAKNYRWSGEKEQNDNLGIPNTVDIPHIIKYRRDKENPEWYPYEEKLGEDGFWDYIGSCKFKIEV